MKLRTVLTFVLGLLIIASSSFGSRGPEEPVQPTEYRSASGEFSIFVDPTDLVGRGPADYVLRKRGEVVWTGRRDFTLYDATVTDDGKVIGYAYTTGLDPRFNDLGEFKVVMFGQDGQALIEEAANRTESRFLHADPNPIALGIELDPTGDRFSIRVGHPDVNKRREELWTYRISTGQRLPRTRREAQEEKRNRPKEKFTPIFELENLPSRNLKEIGALRLKTDGGADSPVRDVLDFRFDAEGRIGFVRQDGQKSYSFVAISQTGELTFETSLEIPPRFVEGFAPRISWVEGDRWVLIASELGEKGRARAWWIDVNRRKVSEVVGFTSASVKQVAGDRAGGFVVLADEQLKYTSEDELSRFDKNGRPLWRKRQKGASGKQDQFLSPDDICVTTDGELIVLDVVQKTIQRFNLGGRFWSAQELAKAWGREPNYPSEIRADLAGGFLVKDFNGQTEVVRMDALGKVRAEFNPRHPDGRKFDSSSGVAVSPEGRVWVSDGESIARLTDDGVVDFVLGPQPNAEALTKIAGITVSQTGEIYAADERTACVHIFNSNGARLRVLKSAVDDFKERLSLPKIAVAPKGDVYLSDWLARRRGFIHFDMNGTRISVKDFGIDSVHADLYPRMDGSFVFLAYRDAYLLSNDGKPTRKISRRADGNWLVYAREGSVAKDGSFAIVSGAGFYSSEPWPATIFSPEGQAVKTIVMPEACRYLVWTGRMLVTRTDDALVGIDPATTQPWRSMLAAEWKDAEIFAPFGGKELWLVDGTRKTAIRFELHD